VVGVTAALVVDVDVVVASVEEEGATVRAEEGATV
jgi:hypothetical protein